MFDKIRCGQFEISKNRLISLKFHYFVHKILMDKVMIFHGITSRHGTAICSGATHDYQFLY